MAGSALARPLAVAALSTTHDYLASLQNEKRESSSRGGFDCDAQECQVLHRKRRMESCLRAFAYDHGHNCSSYCTKERPTCSM